MKCIICNKSNFRELRLIHEASKYNKKKYPLFKCDYCGFIRPFPLPYNGNENLKIYDSSENIKFFNKKTNSLDENTFEFNYYFKHFKPYLNLIKKYNLKGRHLDLGCGAAHLIRLLSKQGFKSEGTEITPLLVKDLNKKGFKIHCCEINSPKLIANSYDLVTANQVLEHIEDPENFIKNLNRILKINGYTILAVPYVHGLIPKILRTKWYGLGYGQHLNFFSQKSMSILLERNGFKVEKFILLNVDYAHPKFPRVLNWIADIISSFIVSIGYGDNLFIVAKKIRNIKK